MPNLQEGLTILDKLGVPASKINISKQVFNDIKEQAKNIACEMLLNKK